jgi:aminoglycoside 6-adenylyltransferase
MQHLKHRLATWIATQPNLRAILVVGSQARRDHPADEWADLDLMLFATDFREYLIRTDWLDNLAQVWVCVPQQIEAGDPELLVLFEGLSLPGPPG